MPESKKEDLTVSPLLGRYPCISFPRFLDSLQFKTLGRYLTMNEKFKGAMTRLSLHVTAVMIHFLIADSLRYDQE